MLIFFAAVQSPALLSPWCREDSGRWPLVFLYLLRCHQAAVGTSNCLAEPMQGLCPSPHFHQFSWPFQIVTGKKTLYVGVTCIPVLKYN